MSRQTDRQTNSRASWWSITAYNDDITKLEDTKSWPVFVKKVLGGREECPTTGRVHFQGAVNTTQQRFSAIKEWLTTAHIEVAIDKECLAKYAMKSDTAIGDKKEVSNPQRYYSSDDMALLMAQQVMEDYDRVYMEHRDVKAFNHIIYTTAMNKVLRVNDKLFGQMMNPSFEKAWLRTLPYWLEKARTLSQKDDPVELQVASAGAGSSITPARP